MKILSSKRIIGRVVFWLIIALAIALAVMWIFSAGKASAPTSEDIKNASSTQDSAFSGLQINSKKIVSLNDTKKTDIDISYPEISGMDKTIADSINIEILSRVNSEIASFKNDLVQLSDDPSNQSGSLDISYDIIKSVKSPNILNIVFSESSYLVNTPHPNNSIITMNFDLNTGKKIKLEYLFDNRFDYLTEISKYCIEDFKKQLPDIFAEQGPDNQIAMAAKPIYDNYQLFAITDDGIKFIFDESVGISHAIGELEVLIPYDNIKDIINKNGPFKVFIK